MMRKNATLAVLIAGLLVIAHGTAEPSVYPCNEPETDAIPVHRPGPAYPHPARMMCLGGTVVLEFTVGVNGRVSNIDVVGAEPEGIFERAAIRAASKWFYLPRCVEGQAVEHQQQTAIDFVLEDAVKANCMDSAEKLTGKYLDFVSAMGTAYSILADLLENPDSHELTEQLESVLQPRFAGDLGAVERFHHDSIRGTLESVQDIRNDSLPHLLALMLPPHNRHRFSADAEMDLEKLQSLRDSSHAQLQRHIDRFDQALKAYAAMHDSTELDPEMLDVLIRPFTSTFDVDEVELVVGAFETESRLIDALFELLRDSMGSWRLSNHGIDFEDADDRHEYRELLAEFTELYTLSKSAYQNFRGAFEDYRP